MEFENQYLTYDEYVELGGTLDETPFNILEMQAQLNIDNYTYGRLKNLSNQNNQVKLCIYQLISTLKSYSDGNARDKSIVSENTDGYSVSYGGTNIELTKSQKQEISNIIDTYLSECRLPNGTPYLHIGG